jgi:Co/Zn/Cd efflux system component
MSANCCTHTHEDQLPDSRYRRVLWAVLAINGAMFLIEIIAGVVAGSASLQADALDFLRTPPITELVCSSSVWHFATGPAQRWPRA